MLALLVKNEGNAPPRSKEEVNSQLEDGAQEYSRMRVSREPSCEVDHDSRTSLDRKN